jgi:hypothetical protein
MCRRGKLYLSQTISEDLRPDSARSLLVLCEHIALITDQPFACRHLRSVLQTVWLSDDMDAEPIYLNFAVGQNSLLGRMLQRACVEVTVLMLIRI